MLTPHEQRLLDRTVDLWNDFLDLPDLHEFDGPELARDIHNIQQRIMARVAKRLHPERFERTHS